MTEGYEALVAAAQVGTRKEAPAPATDLALEGTERTLLLELGALALMRRAGATGVAAEALAPAPPETQRVVDAADALEEALDDSLPSALEWAREAARRGFVAPGAAVSRLAPLAARHPEFRAVLGERGRWLAGIMSIEFAEPLADTLSLEEWEALEPKRRAEWIARSPEDRTLFEKALEDRRKEVREAAAERLVRLPDSAQARALRDLALGAVRIEKGLLKSRMAVELPDPASLSKWLPRSPEAHGVGPGARALFDLVAHVPPSLWGESPDRMLDLSKDTDHARLLNLAWQRAAARFDDEGWLDALLPRMEHTGPLSSSVVIERASDEAFERYANYLLKIKKPELSDLAQLFSLRERPLSPVLSRLFVEATQRHGATGTRQDYQLGYVLPPLGALLDPSVLPLVESGLGDALIRVQEHWSMLLRLRKRLLESLK